MDIWKLWDEGYYVVIPTNQVVKCNGASVMGAGLAKQAAERFPDLPYWYGCNVRAGLSCMAYPEIRVICVATKTNYQQPSKPYLIEYAAEWLAQWGRDNPKETCAVPPLGCGLGQLRWEDVEPMLVRLVQPQFVILAPGTDKI